MKYRKLGKNGPEVSAIGFGCMGLSHGYGNDQSEEEKISVIRKAYEAGCNFFDTAEAYGPYCNEELLGQALAGIRNNCVVATKCGMKNRNGITVLDGRKSAKTKHRLYRSLLSSSCRSEYPDRGFSAMHERTD